MPEQTTTDTPLPGQGGAEGAGDEAKERLGRAQEKASERLGQATDQAKDKASEAADQAKGRAREQVDQRSTQAGEEVNSMAEALRSTGEKLREEGKDGPAKAADRAAEQARKIGGYLVESDADRILGDVEDFARKQPLAVLAGGVALGFAAARFLKASSQGRASGASSDPGTGATAGAPSSAVPRSSISDPRLPEPPTTGGPPALPTSPPPPVARPVGRSAPPVPPAGS